MSASSVLLAISALLHPPRNDVNPIRSHRFGILDHFDEIEMGAYVVPLRISRGEYFLYANISHNRSAFPSLVCKFSRSVTQ